jgi:hypothetical protein
MRFGHSSFSPFSLAGDRTLADLDTEGVRVTMGDVFTVRATGVTKKVLILIEKVNKNYGLPVERLYGRRILENHNFRKKSTATN